MNLTPVKRKAPSRFLIIFTPPAASAGKNFTIRQPAVSAWLSSLAVAMPGQNGRFSAFAAATTAGSKPGATPKTAPAAFARRTMFSSSSVPAPTTASGTSRRIASIAAGAAAVRNVTSRTGRPPPTSALASGTACSSLSITMTGMIPALPSVSIMSMGVLYHIRRRNFRNP